MVKKLDNTKNYIIVIVYWKDHTSDASWFTLHEAKEQKYVMCQTIGWLIHEDNEQLNIVDSLTSDGGFGGVNIILKKCITDIWELDFVPSIYNKN